MERIEQGKGEHGESFGIGTEKIPDLRGINERVPVGGSFRLDSEQNRGVANETAKASRGTTTEGRLDRCARCGQAFSLGENRFGVWLSFAWKDTTGTRHEHWCYSCIGAGFERYPA